MMLLADRHDVISQKQRHHTLPHQRGHDVAKYDEFLPPLLLSD
ncbi:hypothetical protein [Aeromonas sp. QDB68]|nr:hypothetical protein [Aeromonas sp. QDB68]